MRKVAQSVSVNVFVTTEMDSITLRYNIPFSDGTIFEDELTAKYNQPLNLPFDISLIENYFVIFLSQLFLSTGIIDLVCSHEEVTYYQEFSNLLYNIRNYEEGTNCYPKTYKFTNRPLEKQYKNNETIVMNLVSGGKDSLVSDFLLKRNKAKVQRCFVASLNVASDEKERVACQQLYSEFDTIELHGFDRLVTQLVQISDCYGQPPQKNYIPKGRDILTIALIYPLAIQYGCSYISHGCEKDLWENNIEIDGKVIPVHDSQSKFVVEPMSKQLELSTGITLFSPICGMHEIYILTWLIKNHPSKANLIQSCFYDSWCGKCSKCLRYYLIEQSIDTKVFDFKSDPSQMVNDVAVQLKNINAKKKVRYYKELCYLMGDSQYCKELLTPIFSNHFPQFFKEWELG